jgi:polyhydroxyalkanoate synthesis regulator phasin
MDDLHFTEAIRTIFLAGVGAIASSAEKSKDLVDKLVEKGDLTTQQGKILNQELKHKVTDAADDLRVKVSEAIAPKKDDETEKKKIPAFSDDELISIVDSLGEDQLRILKAQLDARCAVDSQ